MFRLSRFRFLRQAAIALLSFTCVVVFAACGSNAPTTESSPSAEAGGSADVLTVANEPAFPPFEQQGAGGELEGFSIDLMNAIGEATGTTIEYESIPFDGIIPALQAGTVDAAISSITITPERAKTVSFSRPYFKAGLAIAVPEENTDITSLESLQDKRIAVQIGTTGAEEAKKVEGAQIRTFDSAPLALQELANGNVDAVINDAPVTQYAIKSGNIPGVKVASGDLLTEEYYGIATPQDSPALETINAGLNTILDNGKYAEIYEKWFGGEPPTLPETAPI